ncbi:MAG: repressor LexA [Clostridiales bacterium]|uniref:transcriptional repressor LexA n=1 Tax=Clostridium sp. N3C TaxID=1776758 RepID=UPI00092DEBE1|nr:transcriptional repressor LexA [Clostridium sp. N3C]NLZ47916.1 repressor LexA [Clostridiales bacterium]SCN26385.1 LexA repressor [Clostridium sp. N3C]
MDIDAAIKKIVLGKPFGLTMVKGAQRSGKTMIAAYRALYLKSSYCLYEGENVLVVATEQTNIDLLKKFYEIAKRQFEDDYRTLFSLLSEEKVNFFTIEDLVDKYYSQYISNSKIKPLIINKEEQIAILAECVEELKSQYNKVRFIKDANVDFIADEINWIKSNDFNNLEEYMKADRFYRSKKKGHPVRLNKKSKSREAICSVMKLYINKLKERNLIDLLDKEKIALQAILSCSTEGYTHMVVDDAHRLSRLQINILMALNSKRAYSSMMLMVDHKAEPIDGAWIVKGRRQKDLGFEVNMRCSYLKKEVAPMVFKDIKVEDKKQNNKFSVEKYCFVDIRHRRSFLFQIDTANSDEVILLQDDKELPCEKDELKTIPVYSNIAAGEPITINPEVEGTFNIPNYWIKGMKDCFMLKVKGDSMIGAGIDDGDFVVIRRQSTANNKDIVAVELDGSATLKRLSIDKNDIMLVPENDKYSPISIKEREALVLGVVVGIIKNAA